MTLTQAAILTKRGLLVLIILSILGIAAVAGYQIWYQNYLSSLPPVEEKPQETFGKLPELNIPAQSVSSSNFSYSIDTATGGMPQVPKLLKVYFIPQAGMTLLAPEKSREKAASLGFQNGPQQVSETVHQFTDDIGSVLTIDQTTGNFQFQKVEATGSAQEVTSSPTQDRLVGDFKNYLASKNSLPDELQRGSSKTAGNEINLWPENFDGLPIVTPGLNQALVKATVKTSSTYLGYTSVKFTYWPIDKSSFSTYQIKTAEEAFADLQKGKGSVIIEPQKPQVSISKAYLAYYQGESYSPYLQPVFVFEGPNFAAYVPAIAPK